MNNSFKEFTDQLAETLLEKNQAYDLSVIGVHLIERK